MTAYHVFEEHCGSAQLIDTCSLVTRELLSCLPPGVLSRHRIGMVLNFRTCFDKQAMIDARCGTRRPDIVFGHSGRGVEAILERDGYSIIYQQPRPRRTSEPTGVALPDPAAVGQGILDLFKPQ
ncbi:hypothetical protein [Sorangium sp. So ce1099]|uniref:hypothetical protein n=1 Tax=Sorangium sp. So ce1099 TaxID=3133331 RepID=UPI003F609FA2